MDVMAGYAANPNIYGTVVVSLGCENCQMDLVVKAIEERTNKPLKQVIIQEVGGTLKAVEIAVRYAKEMVAEASMLQKEEFPLSELIVGTECGGSDPTSGFSSNTVLGPCCQPRHRRYERSGGAGRRYQHSLRDLRVHWR